MNEFEQVFEDPKGGPMSTQTATTRKPRNRTARATQLAEQPTPAPEVPVTDPAAAQAAVKAAREEAKAVREAAKAKLDAAREAAKAAREAAKDAPKVKSAADYRREIDVLIIQAAGSLVEEHVPDDLRPKVAQLIANQLHHLSTPKAGWPGILPLPERAEWAETPTDTPTETPAS
jgi:hypothetical protein